MLVVLFSLFVSRWTVSAQSPNALTLTALSSRLITPRSVHTATLLPDGTVLIAGGMTDGEQFLDSAELFDPMTGTFSATGKLTVKRSTHAAILLKTGKVLLMGGYGQGRLASAELYDPATKTFSSAGTMNSPREGFTATLLVDGQVLIAGGYGSSYRESLDTAELYDPQTGKFTVVGSMKSARASFTATLLENGRVLVAGGRSGSGLVFSAELYDPAMKTFAVTGDLTTARHKHAAAKLPNGDVLIVGGATIESSGVEGQFNSTEIYSAVTGKFTPAPAMHEARYKLLEAVTALPDGRIVIAGAGRSVEVYDQAQGNFVALAGTLDAELFYSTATRLKNGAVFITGGYDNRLRATNAAWIVQPE